MDLSKRIKAGLMALSLSALSNFGFGQQTFGTTVYYDYTFNLTNNGYMTGTDAAKALNNKFNFRRAYFTYENRWGDLRFRFRYDADNTANLTSVDVKTGSTKKDDKLRPFIKHLYLQYDNLIPNTTLRIGMIETITFKLAEDRWGYRSVAKTLADGYKDVTGIDIDQTSADLGVSFSGAFAKEIRYQFQVTNGTHYSHVENDKYKKFMGQLQLVPIAGLNVVGYVDYEKQDASNDAWTYKLDGYFEMVPGLTLAAEWFVYQNDKYLTSARKQYDVSGFSVFGIWKVNPDKFQLFARYDHYEPNTEVKNDEMNLFIAGFDWTPFYPSWKIQPNIWYTTYADSKRKADAVFNLTFFLSF